MVCYVLKESLYLYCIHQIVGVIPWVQRHAPLLGHVSAGRTIRASAVISASPNTTALTLASVSLVNVINTVS